MRNRIEEKILSFYAIGNSYTQIKDHLEENYKVIPPLKEWQRRPRRPSIPSSGSIRSATRSRRRHYVAKALFKILGVNREGKKEVPGLYPSESEGANFRLQVLTDLNNRGVQDIIINSLKYVASKNQKEFAKDLQIPVRRRVHPRRNHFQGHRKTGNRICPGILFGRTGPRNSKMINKK